MNYSALTGKTFGCQRSSTSGKFLGAQWCEACGDDPSKVKDKLLHLVPRTTKKEVQPLVGLFGLMVADSSFGCVSLTHLLSDPKSY